MIITEAFMDGLPPLAPIRTAAVHVDTAGAAATPTATESSDDGECATPKSEEHVLKPALVCPPAPRKPRPAKRRLKAPARGFFLVPRDLDSLFISLAGRPSKRTRVG